MGDVYMRVERRETRDLGMDGSLNHIIKQAFMGKHWN